MLGGTGFLPFSLQTANSPPPDWVILLPPVLIFFPVDDADSGPDCACLRIVLPGLLPATRTNTACAGTV